MHHENKNKNNRRNSNQPKMKTTWVRKGMFGKFVSNKQANIRKGKGKKKTNKRHQT